MKLRLNFITLIAIAITVLFTVIACSTGTKTSTNLAPEMITDYIHRILKSERTVYGRYVVQRLSEAEIIHASENWERDNALPLPAQMFRMTADLSSQDGSFSYSSISPWNLNDANAPKTDFEKQAMQTVIETGLPYKGKQSKDGKEYFSALYPDKAVTESCANCHNQHPIHKQRYPDKVFKVGDVMGGIIINIPLDEG